MSKLLGLFFCMRAAAAAPCCNINCCKPAAPAASDDIFQFCQDCADAACATETNQLTTSPEQTHAEQDLSGQVGAGQIQGPIACPTMCVSGGAWQLVTSSSSSTAEPEAANRENREAGLASMYCLVGQNQPENSTQHPNCACCQECLHDGQQVLAFPTCGHAYHCDCIGPWLEEHNTCPQCRGELEVFAKKPDMSGSSASVDSLAKSKKKSDCSAAGINSQLFESKKKQSTKVADVPFMPRFVINYPTWRQTFEEDSSSRRQTAEEEFFPSVAEEDAMRWRMRLRERDDRRRDLGYPDTRTRHIPGGWGHPLPTRQRGTGAGFLRPARESAQLEPAVSSAEQHAETSQRSVASSSSGAARRHVEDEIDDGDEEEVFNQVVGAPREYRPEEDYTEEEDYTPCKDYKPLWHRRRTY